MTGVNIKVRYGPDIANLLTLRVRKVDVDDAVGEIDETDSESGGYGECDETGVAQADVTLEGFTRSADLAPLKRGDLLLNVLIAWDGNVAVPVVNKRDLFTKLKILSCQRTGETRGGSIVYTLRCKSSGTYYPMGVAGP